MFWHRLLRDDRGASMVEFAIIALLFFVLVFGIIEIALALFQWKSADKATQLGARLAVVSGPAPAGFPTSNTKVDPTVSFGTPCRLGGCVDFGTFTCTAATCGGDAFGYIVGRMQDVYPWLEAADVTIRYSYAGLGFVGGPPAPAVRVEISRPFNFIALSGLVNALPGGGGFPNMIMNVKSATLTGEDLRTVYAAG